LALLVVPWKEREIVVRLVPFSKIIILVAVVFFAATFVFYKGTMMLRADSYFMDTRNKERISNCAALPVSRLAVVANPDESVYREEYIYNALNCLEAVVGEEEKKVLMNNIELSFSDIPPKEMNYFLKIELANSFSVNGRYFDKSYNEKAEKAFTDLLEEYPNISQVYFYYAFHKLRYGDYDGVLSLVAKVDELLPQLKLPIYFLDIEHRQSIADERVRFYDLAASASEKKGDLMAAADYYLKAVRANPRKLIDYKRRADMYYLSGQIDDAITCNQRGYAMSRKDYSWPLAISLLYESKEDGDMAVEYARQALAINETATSALKILEKYGKIEK
jgi:tetratricopeptide (TPR) repeat protein